ncbi:MAG: hypothetical protein ACKO7N_04205, partial [Candidatus Nitrosotenuis sp.]
LAWVESVEVLISLVEKHVTHQLFIDIPIGRTKPPSNRYDISEIIHVIEKYDNIRYLAISNVEKPEDFIQIQNQIPERVIIVPKIESTSGVNHIQEIISSLRASNKIIMLDHDDLYTSLIKNGKNPSDFKDYLIKLSEFCNKNDVILLRTIGVIFSDEEKKINQYVK